MHVVSRRTSVGCIVIVLLLSLMTLSGCQKQPPPDPGSPPTSTPTVTEGDTFLSSGFKIRTEIKTKNSVSSDPLIFEVYVDGSGNGAGLVGYQDNVYDVYMVEDQVYVVVSDDVVVHITDVTAHMVPSSLSLAGSNDLKTSGFAVLEGRVVSYTGGTDAVDMVSKYESSVSTFDPVAIAQSNNMTTNDLLKYFFEKSSTVYVEPVPPTQEEIERQSYYVNSEYGITIRGVNYSVGDFCAPYTYFEECTPQGMNERYAYKEDEKVTFVYISYLSTDGNTMFMTTDGYVQAINTTSDFVFLDQIKKGMSKEKLDAVLGFGLKKEEAAAFKPIVEGLKAYKDDNVYTLKLGDLTIELEVHKKNKTLVSITLTNYLDFRS